MAEERRWGVMLVVLAAALPLVIAAGFGAIGLPRNDDWSYHEILNRWAGGGGLHLNGYESMFLVGHLLLAWPVAKALPDNIASLQILTACAGAVGVGATWWTLRRFLSVGRATLAAALVVLSPLWGPLAASFMTDVPAFAAQAGCLALGAAALERSDARARVTLAAAAAVVGLAGATVREYAVVAPAAVLVVLLTRAIAGRARKETRALAVLTIGAAVVYTPLFLWRRSLPRSLSFTPSFSWDLGDVGRSVIFTIITLAFLALPAFAFVPWRSLAAVVGSRRWAIVAAAAAIVALLAGIARVWDWSPPLLGPYLDQRGPLGNDILDGDRTLLLPEIVLKALLGITAVAAVALVVIVASTGAELAASRRRLATLDARALAWVFVVLSTLGLVAIGVGHLPLFDRYLLAAAPLGAGLVLAWGRRGELPLFADSQLAVLQWVTVGVFAMGGLYWSANSAAFDVARWRAGERAVALGIPPDRVDAGFEWRNTHRRPGEAATSPFQRDADACVTAKIGPGEPAIDVVDLQWPFARVEGVTLVFHPERPGCSPPP